MTPEIARAALAFLSRTEMKGHEVDAFLSVCAALRQAAEPAPVQKKAMAKKQIPVVSTGK